MRLLWSIQLASLWFPSHDPYRKSPWVGIYGPLSIDVVLKTIRTLLDCGNLFPYCNEPDSPGLWLDNIASLRCNNLQERMWRLVGVMWKRAGLLAFRLELGGFKYQP